MDVYTIISVTVFILGVIVLLIIFLHDLGLDVDGYVFDTTVPYKKTWNYQIVNGDLGLYSLTWIIGGPIASALWPLMLLSLLIWGTLYMMRGIVRKTRLGLEDHVSEYHGNTVEPTE